MTAQVIATPPGTAVLYQSNATIPAEAGVVYSIADVDPNGAVGPVLDPLALPREPIGNDLQLTLPDGTVLIFEGIIPLLAQGAVGIAGPDGQPAIASIESAVAPAAGPDGGPDGGSSSAFNPFIPIDPRIFGEAPEGPFIGLGLPGFGIREEDENILLVEEVEVVEESPPDVPEPPDPNNDIVITEDDDRIIVLGRALLANDAGNNLTIVSVQDYSGPGGDASVSLDPDGNIIIDPVTANPGDDNSGVTQTLTYTVEDANGQTATATVLVYVDEFRFLDGFIGQPPGPPPGDLGNGESEIFITLDPSPNQNQPPEVQTIFGGNGDDFFQLRDEQNTNPFGGEGFDTLLADPEFSSEFMEYDLPDVFSQANNSIERIDASDEISANGIVRLTPHFLNSAVDWDFTDIELLGIDEIRGSLQADTIVGSAGDDTILGNNGNDTLSGGAGEDLIDGGNDADTIDGGADDDSIIGGAGQDSILGGSGNDEISGGGSSDSISGGDGDDTIFGNGGTDTINGGAGDDFIDVGDNTVNSERVVISDRDDGIDTIDNFDELGNLHETLDLDALFDDLEVDIELGPGGLSTADRIARVSLVQDGADTDVFIDASATGDGSALVQIAVILDSSAIAFQIGETDANDILVGA